MSLEVVQLGKTFFKNQVLQDISFAYGSGLIGVAGHNGSGKSTLFRLMMGLLLPSSGQILLDKQPVTKQRNTFAYAASQLQFGLDFTALDYLRALSAARGQLVSKDTLQQELRRWNVQHAERPLAQLSFGNLQKINLIQALMHKQASVYLFDEPMNGLDTDLKAHFEQELRALASQKLVFLILHDLEELDQLCDDMLWLRGGRLIGQGKTAFRECQQCQITFRGEIDQAMPFDARLEKFETGHYSLSVPLQKRNELVQYLVRHNFELLSISIPSVTLADVYQGLGY